MEIKDQFFIIQKWHNNLIIHLQKSPKNMGRFSTKKCAQSRLTHASKRWLIYLKINSRRSSIIIAKNYCDD